MYYFLGYDTNSDFGMRLITHLIYAGVKEEISVGEVRVAEFRG